MSNPGVITLTQKKISPSQSFRVEDNLGECIHFHYNDIRIDLTIRELIEIAEICDITIYDLIHVESFLLDDYDNEFLMRYSRELIDLIKIEKVDVPVKELYFKDETSYIPRLKHISKCNFIESKMIESDNVHLPVIFNNINILASGIDYVADCYNKDCSSSITLICMSFDKNKHSFSKHPTLDFFFQWDKQRIKSCVKKMARIIR